MNVDPNTTRREKARFLAAYARVGVIAYACRTVKVGRATVYEWQEKDPAFVEAMAEGLKIATELMEDETHRRAVRGTLSPVYYKGEVVGHVREYSDTLLMFLLKRHNPAFRDQSAIDVRGQLKLAAEITITDARAAAREVISEDDVERLTERLLG